MTPLYNHLGILGNL